MARITVDLNDLINTFRNKFNELSYNVGDLSLLTTSGDSALVQAVNELDSELSALTIQVNNFDPFDSAEVINLIGLQAPIVAADIDGNAVITSKINNLAVTTAKIDDDAVNSQKLNNAINLILYDSTGVAVKSLYGASI